MKPVLLRRRKDEVLRQLPARIDQNIFVPLTREQRTLHDEFYEIVVKIVAKWRRYKFLTEADQRRLMIALEGMRRSADNTYLVDKKTIHGPKIEELEELLQENILEGEEKAVIFSQWLRMTELVEAVLKRNDIGYVHLNGSLPSRKRRDLLTQFKDDDRVRVFLSTDAGGVGLNLQSGSLVINMDIPWNPAVLEQRIGRVHRLGQRRTVRVVNFVSSGSIEARILELLKFKKSVFAGALDQDGEDVVMIGESQMKRFLKTVETLTENIEKSDPLVEQQAQREAERDEALADRAEQLERDPGTGVAVGVPALESGKGLEGLNTLLVRGAEFLMNLSQTLTAPTRGNATPSSPQSLSPLLERDEVSGRAFLKIPMPEPEAIQTLLSSLGALLGGLTGRQKKLKGQKGFFQPAIQPLYTTLPSWAYTAAREVLFSYSSGVRVIMSRGTMNFLIVLISASLVRPARLNMFFFLKSSDTMTMSISLSSVAVPLAGEPKTTSLETFNPFSWRHSLRNFITSEALF